MKLYKSFTIFYWTEKKICKVEISSVLEQNCKFYINFKIEMKEKWW